MIGDTSDNIYMDVVLQLDDNGKSTYQQTENY